MVVLHTFKGNFSHLFVILDDYTASLPMIASSNSAFVPEVEPGGKSLPEQSLWGSPSRSLFLPSPFHSVLFPSPLPDSSTQGLLCISTVPLQAPCTYG